MPGLSDFEGLWRIERQVANAIGEDARFDGTARFAPDGAALVLKETGQMRLAGQVFHAERSYTWRVQDGLIAVSFDDGRHFHSFDPALSFPTAHHDCPPDDYAAFYDFTAWPVWQAEWRVRGPRKDYRMRTTYSPAR